MVYYGGGKIKAHLFLIFLVTLFIGAGTVVAADSSNHTTLSLDEQPTVRSDNYDHSSYNDITSYNVNSLKKSNFESNDNVSIKSEKTESIQTTNNTTKQQKTATAKQIATQSKSDINIQLDPIKTVSNQTIEVNAVVKTTSGSKVTGPESVLKINGITKSRTTVINGIATFYLEIPNWTSKDYEMLVKVGETDSTYGGSTTSTLTLQKRNIVIDLPSYSEDGNSNVEFKANVYYTDGRILADAPAVFKLNGKTIGSTRVKNGVVALNYTAPSSGEYSLMLKVGETSYTNENSKTSNAVFRSSSKIIINDIFFAKKGSAVTIIAQILDSKNNKINTGTVAFKVNGKTVDNVKVSNGEAKVVYSNTDALSNVINNITVKYSGNSYITQSNATSTLRVQSRVANYSYADVLRKANDTKVFIEKWGQLPNYVTFPDDHVSPEDFLYMLCQVYTDNSTFCVAGFDNGVTSKTNCNNEKIYKEDYIKLANEIVQCYAKNGRAPRTLEVNGKVMDFADAFYFYTRAVAYIANHGICSAYGTVLSFSAGDEPYPVPEGYEDYVKRTANCEVNDSAIKQAVHTAISGVTGIYNQAVAIFNYVRDRTSYSGYYNTRYGAKGTLSRGYGNCCDMSNLVIAMMRTLGIPARYNHATCYFSSGLVTGHVWAEVYIDGKWYKCDATSKRNSFGNIVNWYSCTNHKRYIELPF